MYWMHYNKRDQTITRGLESLQDAVTDFHECFGAPVGDFANPAIPDSHCRLRIALIAEELDELRQAFDKRDLVAATDALADLMYVVMGGFVALGVEAGPILEEVHRSNMSKLGPDMRAIIREDGKVLKGPSYEPPGIAGALDAQRDYWALPDLCDETGEWFK